MSAIDELLADVDRRWIPSPAGSVELRIIGASALLLQSDYDRATKDSDVLETAALDGADLNQLLTLAGKQTALALKHRLYIDPVPSGLPFLPQSARWHSLAAMSARLKHFHVYALDVVDVVVSKLLRFSANDRSDVDAMIARDLVEHRQLLARFRSAVDVLTHDARCHRLPSCIANLHAVERDSFGVGETEIELPAWIAES